MSFSITARQLITDAFGNIGVYTPNPTAYSDAFRWMNQIIQQWALQPLTSTATRREAFVLTPGQGTPANPYTIGDGGDFDTTRPISIAYAATLVTTQSTPYFEVDVQLLTDAAYWAITQKTLASPYATSLYYEPTYADGFGKIYLYPVPSQANSLVLYLTSQVAEFDLLNTPMDLPPGADVALTWDLAKRCAVPFGRGWTRDMEVAWSDAQGLFQRANTDMTDLTLDPALTNGVSGVWNIQSDSINGRNR